MIPGLRVAAQAGNKEVYAGVMPGDKCAIDQRAAAEQHLPASCTGGQGVSP